VISLHVILDHPDDVVELSEDEVDVAHLRTADELGQCEQAVQ
jgi:hypothetical protein